MLPTLYTIAGGRFEATCGGCLRYSAPVVAADEGAAWEELQRSGWTQRHAYALCPACTADPPDPDKDAAKAKKGRRRK
jgi:hypothetical protein